MTQNAHGLAHVSACVAKSLLCDLVYDVQALDGAPLLQPSHARVLAHRSDRLAGRHRAADALPPEALHGLHRLDLRLPRGDVEFAVRSARLRRRRRRRVGRIPTDVLVGLRGGGGAAPQGGPAAHLAHLGEVLGAADANEAVRALGRHGTARANHHLLDLRRHHAADLAVMCLALLLDRRQHGLDPLGLLLGRRLPAGQRRRRRRRLHPVVRGGRRVPSHRAVVWGRFFELGASGRARAAGRPAALCAAAVAALPGVEREAEPQRLGRVQGELVAGLHVASGAHRQRLAVELRNGGVRPGLATIHEGGVVEERVHVGAGRRVRRVLDAEAVPGDAHGHRLQLPHEAARQRLGLHVVHHAPFQLQRRVGDVPGHDHGRGVRLLIDGGTVHAQLQHLGGLELRQRGHARQGPCLQVCLGEALRRQAELPPMLLVLVLHLLPGEGQPRWVAVGVHRRDRRLFKDELAGLEAAPRDGHEPADAAQRHLHVGSLEPALPQE
mmetsp:Transcript_125200/g.350572  ORF Transcript_125200/g.350572 Transcript_125200/m.350572 type:complete len:496 (-) Transcript_125200:140-1627(-)